jgi:lactate racemase
MIQYEISKMKQTINIHYGKEILPLKINDGVLKYELKPLDIEPVDSISEEVLRALRHPVNSKKLNEIVKKGNKVIILVDDITRLTPAKQILPPVLNEINQGGVPDEDITIVIALGTHRQMTQDEINSKYGEAVVNRVKIVNHNCLDNNNLKHYGTTRRGTDIWVNRLVVEADVRIGIGNIVPHFPIGWSGGAKILLPGVAGERTIGQVHLLGATEQLLGQIETPCREEMEEFAAITGLEFIVNTVLDRDGKVVHMVAGHFVDAHREGVKWGIKVFGVPFTEKTDITISSSFPVDNDLFQASKGIFSGVISTKKGGELILLSPCYEGVGPTHLEVLELAHFSDEELFRKARDPNNKHDPLSITAALYFHTVTRGCKITLVADNIPEDVAQKLSFNSLKASQLQEYLDALMDGKKLTLGLIHNSAETLPTEA